jgi:predicted dehydrogenase
VNHKQSVSRREVFAATAFTIVAPGAVRGSQANSRISVGLIGSGNRGSYDASIVHADPRASITAMCDLFDDQIEQAKQRIKVDNPAVYKDFDKLLASDVDAVIIATPVFEHPRMLEAAVAAGKHIYCEKPAGVDAEGCFRVMQAGRKAGSRLNISFGFQQRYGPVYIEGYNRWKAGQIGTLTGARAWWLGGSVQQRPPKPGPRIRNWYSHPELCGDIIVEQDCHNMDVLHWFLDSVPLRATGYGGRIIRTWRNTLDHLAVIYEWPGGLHVAFEASQVIPEFRRVGEEFSGTKGTIWVSRNEMRHHKSRQDVEEMTSDRNITMDALEAFLDKVETGQYENVAVRSALSTMIAILGREAVYRESEVTWKGLFGVHA